MPPEQRALPVARSIESPMTVETITLPETALAETALAETALAEPVYSRPSAVRPASVMAELPAAHRPGTGLWGLARAVSRIVVWLTWTLALIPVQAVALRLSAWGIWPGFAIGFPTFYHRSLCRILGITIELRGVAPAPAPVLIIANHCSWLDVIVLSSIRPLSFVAKAEVATWPFFGLLAKLQRTVFVERERRSRVTEHKDEITRRLAAGDALVLFPEGTTNEGNRMIPFKTALFSAAATTVDDGKGGDRPIIVQPWSVAYTGLNNMPMGWDQRHFYAWYGDMELAPHLWQILQMGPVTVRVELHPPVTLAEFDNRKHLSAHCERAVAEGLSAALAGRQPPPARILGRPFP